MSLRCHRRKVVSCANYCEETGQVFKSFLLCGRLNDVSPKCTLNSCVHCGQHFKFGKASASWTNIKNRRITLLRVKYHTAKPSSGLSCKNLDLSCIKPGLENEASLKQPDLS